MMRCRYRRILASVSLTAVLAGCASFNDSLVVDIGDQFELVKLDGLPARANEAIAGRGFECTFEAHSQRSSLFGRDRQVNGMIRCMAIAAPVSAD